MEKYCSDLFASDKTRAPDLSFGREDPADHLQEGSPGPWQRSASLDDVAWIWEQQGKVVHAGLYIPSEDWETVVNYYFRSDGSVEEIRSDVQNETYGQIDEREWVFDPTGRVIKFDEQFLDEYSGKTTKLNPDFADIDTPFYLRISDLPFASLLPKQSARP